MNEESLKEAFLVNSNNGTPCKFSSVNVWNSINGLNFAPKHKESTRTMNRKKKRLLHTYDTFLSMLIICPLVITNWRGTWAFMDHHEKYFPSWNCFIVGGVLHTTLVILREYLHLAFATPNDGIKSWRRTALRHFVTKLYTYTFSIACVLHWRGGWALLNEYIGEKLWHAGAITVVNLIPLVALRGCRNLIGVPFIIINDFKDCTFAFPTRFRTLGTREPALYLLDCLFSVFVVGSLVVFVWRGVWVFLDIMIYPEDVSLSAFSSLAIGYGIVAVTFALQPVMRWTCERLTGVWRIATADLFLFFSFLGTVNVWRGVWMLLDQHFIPNNPMLSDLVTHAASIILLALLNCSNTVLVRGVYLDAEEPDGQCVVFPVYYIRLFFQKERLKKQRRMTDSEKGCTGINCHNTHSLRQQMMRQHKLSSHVNFSDNNSYHQNQVPVPLSQPLTSNSNIHSQVSVSGGEVGAPTETEGECRLNNDQDSISPPEEVSEETKLSTDVEESHPEYV